MIDVGKPFLLGKVSLSEAQIIEYAKVFDPLEFHTSVEAGKKSIYGGLIASGPHVFQVMHSKFWIPLYGKTVLAGLEVNNWKFLKPVYPNKEVECHIAVLSKKLNSDHKTITVKWLYEFRSADTTELLQCLEMTILHKSE
jgi:acyl dehydratase